jgi:hypothetical protein
MRRHLGHRTPFDMRTEQVRQAQRRQGKGDQDRKRTCQRKTQPKAHAVSR